MISKDNARSLLSSINGFFFSGGGFVSHGEGAGLTWGWYNLFGLENKTLTDFFSDTVVATTSGGGWFFTDIVYSSEFRDVVSASTNESFIDGMEVYYRKLISNLYGITEEEIIEKTDSGKFSAMSETDYTTLLGSGNYHSWQDMVMAIHYNYKQEEMLELENTAWQSTFGLATQFENEYTLNSGLSIIDDQQRSTWNYDIPGFFDYEYKNKGEEPSIEVILPALDDKYASVCSLIKTKRKCKKRSDCMENSYCDTVFKLCICDNTHTVAKNDEGDEYCMDCAHPSDDAKKRFRNGEDLKPVEKVKVVWNKNTFTKDPEAIIHTDKLKEIIKESISDDPKKFSGPSSAAMAVEVAKITSKVENEIIRNIGMETAWETARLTDEFDNSKAPTLDLIDGGGQDNCAITALVHKLQSKAMSEGLHLKSMEWNVVGMCAQADLEALIYVPGKEMDSKYNQFQLFEYVNEPPEEMEPFFLGDVMVVYAYKLRTLYEPMNGVLPGSIVNIFAHSFPTESNCQKKDGKSVYVPKKGGICRNWGNSIISLDSFGMEKCQYNMPKSKKTIKPMMSLLPGRGETREVRFAAKFILDDMKAFNEALPGLLDKTKEPEEATSKEEL